MRRFVADTALRWKLADAGILILLASELATNAILHGRTEFEVRILLEEDVVRVEVRDENTRAPVAALVPGDATTGRGLLMVQSLSYRWGIDAEQEGKSVWFELPCRTVDVRAGS